MGIDAFSDEPEDDDEQQEEVEDEPDEETTSDDEEEEQGDNESGLKAFVTKKKESKDKRPAPKIETTDGKDVPNSLIGDISSSEWNEMNKVERVKYARANGIPDFRPDVHVDDRWEWKHVTEVRCVCDNVFTFDSMGLCLGCGRVYKTHGGLSRRVVELVHEPEDGEENNGKQHTTDGNRDVQH